MNTTPSAEARIAVLEARVAKLEVIIDKLSNLIGWDPEP